MLITSRVYNQVAYQMRPTLKSHVILTGTGLGVKWQKNALIAISPITPAIAAKISANNQIFVAAAAKTLCFGLFRRSNVSYNLVNSARMFP